MLLQADQQMLCCNCPELFCCCRDGKLNAVVFWYELRLTQDIVISTGPVGFGSGALMATL